MLHYAPETGEFTWRVSRLRAKVGTEAGFVSKAGYRVLKVDRHIHTGQALAWLWVTGVMPKQHVHHLNRVKDDNRFHNLFLWGTGPRAQEQELTHSLLQKLIHYLPETGEFRWKMDAPTGTAKAGALVTKSERSGYHTIVVMGRKYYAHRLAWFYTHGGWPPNIDHDNRVRTDNRIENLRSCSQAENMQNTKLRRDNSSGLYGVSTRTDGSHFARVRVEGRVTYLGSYRDPDRANAAAVAAKGRLHTFHPEAPEPRRSQ